MGDVRSEKVNCKVKFGHDSEPGRINSEFDAVMHLFVHPYGNGKIPDFWYGVLDIACTIEQLVLATAAYVNKAGVRVYICLEDGRHGIAHQVFAHANESEGSPRHCQVAVTGMSVLETKG